MDKDTALRAIIIVAFNEKVTKTDYQRFKRAIKSLGLRLDEVEESATELGFSLMWKKDMEEYTQKWPDPVCE